MTGFQEECPAGEKTNWQRHGQSWIHMSLPVKRGLPGKDLISEIQTKMLKASQVAGFLNQLYLKEKWMKLSSLLYVDTNWRIDMNEELTCFHFPNDPKSQSSHAFQLSNQKLLSACQKFFYSFLRYSQFPTTWVSTPIFSHTNSFTFWHECKKSVQPFIIEMQPILETCDQSGHAHPWPCLPKKNLNQLLVFMNLYIKD